jgi:hypothetical protein
MRNRSFVLCLVALATMTSFAYAEDAPVAEPVAAAETVPPEAPAATKPVPDAPPDVPAEAVVPGVAAPETPTDNLEFVSGEISEMDESSKSVSIRLYGEDETAASEKVLKVFVDENTDVTDGEQDRNLKSLTVGTEVDVEYDPASSKATYIFVY